MFAWLLPAGSSHPPPCRKCCIWEGQRELILSWLGWDRPVCGRSCSLILGKMQTPLYLAPTNATPCIFFSTVFLWRNCRRIQGQQTPPNASHIYPGLLGLRLKRMSEMQRVLTHLFWNTIHLLKKFLIFWYLFWGA